MIKIELSGIKKMESIAQTDSKIISLSQGGLKVDGIDPQIKSYMQRLLLTATTDYYGPPVGIMPLREKLAEMLNLKHNLNLDHDNIIVSHGASGALASLFCSLLDEGDEVILPEPTYPAYKNLAVVAKAYPIFISMLNQDNSGASSWKLDIERVKSAITPRTKMLVLSNPSNPLGIVFDKKTIEQLATLCHEKGIYFIVDEVYDDYIFKGELYSATNLVESNPHVIRIGSFSKNFSMSGWRVGYMVIPHSLKKTVEAVQDSLVVCPSVLSQHGALYALNHPEIALKNKEIIEENLELTAASFSSIEKRGHVSFEKPIASFYLFFKTHSKNNEALCIDIAKNAHVALIPGACFGPSGAEYIRLCYARKSTDLAEALRRLSTYWKD